MIVSISCSVSFVCVVTRCSGTCSYCGSQLVQDITGAWVCVMC